MDNDIQLLVFVISLVSQGNLVSLSQPDNFPIVMCVSVDLDEKYFAQLAPNKSDLQIWHSDSRRLVVTADNPLQSLLFMEAPKLEQIEIYPNTRLEQLILRFCPLDGLENSFEKLQALRILKIEQCQMRGTFNLAELLPLRNLTSLSLETNLLTEIINESDAASNETELTSPLQELNLGSNSIAYFNLDVLRTFPNLKNLLLQRNKLVRIAGSVSLPTLATLHAKQNQLTEVNLSGCNCSALLFLYVSDNRLSNFPLLGDRVAELQVLDLTNNRLTTFNVTELNKQQNLTTLLMSSNALKNLSTGDENEPTVQLPLLTALEMCDNQIEVLDLRGWQLPSLQTLMVNVNPLVALPDDLIEQFPKLKQFSCYCANINCEWIQRNVQLIRSGKFEMSVAWKGPQDVGEGYRCVTVPHIGCVRCPFKRSRPTTERVR